ncbi:TPA: Plug domain-containing protein, partial [bacterium]|nr:Plug domain-containing protein [bacterium]
MIKLFVGIFLEDFGMFKYKTFCILVSILALVLLDIVQADDVYILDEISIVGTRNERDTFGTPSAVSIVTSDDIGRQGLGTTPDALRGANGVMVQKTSAGQGSPY